MSRIVVKNKKYELAYGMDHVLGLFVQVFQNGIEDPVEDRDNCTIDDVIYTAERYGFDADDLAVGLKKL